MEALPKQNQGVVVVIGIDDVGEEEQANQTDNDEEREDSRRCSSSCSNEAKSGTIDERGPSVSSLEVDLEAETKLHLENVETDCRICHLSLDPSNQECDFLPIELGCYCKHDLAAAHKQCAEAWFKIKGNRFVDQLLRIFLARTRQMTEQWNDSNDSAAAVAPAATRGTVSKKLLAGPSVSKFPTSLYGLCLCNLLALSLRHTIVKAYCKRVVCILDGDNDQEVDRNLLIYGCKPYLTQAIIIP